jgi:hypothetical protein
MQGLTDVQILKSKARSDWRKRDKTRQNKTGYKARQDTRQDKTGYQTRPDKATLQCTHSYRLKKIIKKKERKQKPFHFYAGGLRFKRPRSSSKMTRFFQPLPVKEVVFALTRQDKTRQDNTRKDKIR